MRRLVLTFALAATPFLAACGGGEVVVQAAVAGEEGAEPSPLPNLEVRALPYDRDAIFDELRSAYGEPEPQIPDSLTALQQQIAAAQEEWQEAEADWNAARDSLRTLSEQMQSMSRGDPRYVVAFRDFGAQETREQQARRANEQAFGRFEELQARFNNQSSAIRQARQEWGDEAFAAIDSVIELRLEELDREEYADTTNPNGVVRFELPEGQWWIHARYDLPYSELYWNVPVDVARGEPITIQLNRSTAEVRPKL